MTTPRDRDDLLRDNKILAAEAFRMRAALSMLLEGKPGARERALQVLGREDAAPATHNYVPASQAPVPPTVSEDSPA